MKSSRGQQIERSDLDLHNAAAFTGIHGAARSWLLAKLIAKHPRVVVVCPRASGIEQLRKELQTFIAPAKITCFSPWDILPFEPVSPQQRLSAERLSTLYDLLSGKPLVLITSIEALAQKVLPQHAISSLSFTLSTGDQLPHSKLVEKLELCSYRRVSLVESEGEMAVRGGVIDLFPPQNGYPVRIEFLDDLIERIKEFDPASQRSVGSLETISVTPAKEIIRIDTAPNREALLADALKKIKSRGKELEIPPRVIEKVSDAIETAGEYPALETIQACAFHLQPFFQYLKPDDLIVLDDSINLDNELDAFWELVEERETRYAEEQEFIPAKEDLYLDPSTVLTQLGKFPQKKLEPLELFQADDQTLKVVTSPLSELRLALRAQHAESQTLAPLAKALRQWRERQFRIVFAIGSRQRAERLSRLLQDYEIEARLFEGNLENWEKRAGQYPIAIVLGEISEGVLISDSKIVIIAEQDIFGERSHRSEKATKASVQKILSSLGRLQEGDYVVHADYGVGIYRGLKHFEVEEKGSDFLHLEYAGKSKLYLPIDNIGKIQKFAAVEGQTPQLDRLGSNSWEKTKRKVRDSVETLAADLIKLYASRQIMKGWTYDPAGAADENFADDFAFDETPDQLTAIQDVLADLASEKPMDRLVCGDAGYGKTEVAMRAAYKCLQHGRQVAVLVPTTILAEQHRLSFMRRFLHYPVQIGAVSRFYTSAQNKQTVEDLKNGKIDIIIGTHRLLSRDIEFADLGLLVIDEEHRFGVRQKEKLKALRKNVDVLTLTATPIPRTLHMSLLGLRDISVITTPPHDRRTIRTYVAKRGEGMIRDAIMKELQRDGQVFFLYNRVQSIQLITHELRELVPEARFEFAHGQMKERALEDIMKRFIDREIDVLVSTTIIENGLDIPNANTIIVDRADTFGLAQLYQLRGRVGRSSRQAYAYLLIPETKKLKKDAQARLKVLQMLDDLGMGFNLAVRDLEIRGAGNLLGKEQSGNVLAVGFELYSKILKEAILHLKGAEVDYTEDIDPEVKIGVNAYLPEYYIPDISQRLIMYQRLASAKDSPEIDHLAEELEDRFGGFSEEIANFIELMRYRALLRSFGVEKADFADGRLLLSFAKTAPVNPEQALSLVRSHPDKYRLGRNRSISMYCDFKEVQHPSELFGVTERLLRNISVLSGS